VAVLVAIVALKLPFASVLTLTARAPPRIVTVAPATAAVPSATVPVTSAASLFTTFFARTVRCLFERKSDCTSTVPAGFGVPAFGVYGVTVARQRYSPGAPPRRPLLSVSAASKTLAPKVARPGVPAGTSGGGRQRLIVADANVNGLPAGIGSTNSGTSSV